jgi:beta-lactamase regulating signal transducer with metallopeptidase domain
VSAAGLALLLGANGAAWAVGSLLKGTLLLIAVFLVAAALRRASAGVRHLVWTGGIAAVLLLPLVSLVLPWRLSVIRVPAPAAAPRVSAPPVGGAVSGAPAGSATAAPVTGLVGSSGPSAVPARSWLTLPAMTLSQWVFWIWLAGALVVLLRLLRGAMLVRRVLRRATPLDSPDWTRPLIEAADRLGLAHEPLLLWSDAVLMPIVCGVFRPAIVLPSDAREWTDRRRRAVLCHELAHVRRYDLGLTILSRIGCAIYWFHPLVWVAARRLRLESERACDDMVLGVGTRPSEYADHLLQIACGAGSMRSPAAALPMAERREFEGRMLAILEKDARRTPASRRSAALLAALGLAVMLPLAAMGMARVPQAEADRRPAPAERPAPNPNPNPAPVAAPASQSGTPLAGVPLARSEQTHTELHQATKTSTSVVAQTSERTSTGDEKAAGADTLDPRTLAALEGALDDSVASVRLDAAFALGRLEAEAAVGALGTSMRRDPDAAVREMAAWALGQIQSHESTAALVAAAGRDASEEVRAMAVWALGQIQDSASVPGLVTALGDASAEVRGRAAWAIGTIQPGRAPHSLIAALGDASSGVRLRAAWALGQIADGIAAPALLPLLNDTAPEVRRAAMWALGKMDAPEAHQALLDALKNSDPAIRASAARALSGSSGDPWPWPWPMPLIR